MSKISSVFYELLCESLREVFRTHEIKNVRFQYYGQDNIQRLTNVKIIYEMGRIFVLTEHINKEENTSLNMGQGKILII